MRVGVEKKMKRIKKTHEEFSRALNQADLVRGEEVKLLVEVQWKCCVHAERRRSHVGSECRIKSFFLFLLADVNRK